MPFFCALFCSWRVLYRGLAPPCCVLLQPLIFLLSLHWLWRLLFAPSVSGPAVCRRHSGMCLPVCFGASFAVSSFYVVGIMLLGGHAFLESGWRPVASRGSRLPRDINSTRPVSGLPVWLCSPSRVWSAVFLSGTPGRGIFSSLPLLWDRFSTPSRARVLTSSRPFLAPMSGFGAFFRTSMSLCARAVKFASPATR